MAPSQSTQLPDSRLTHARGWSGDDRRDRAFELTTTLVTKEQRMTRHDGEQPEPTARNQPTDQPLDQPVDPANHHSADVTGTWANVSPFATSPESYGPGPRPASDEPTGQFGAPASGPAPTGAQPEWGTPVWSPPPSVDPANWGGPSASPPPTWGAPPPAGGETGGQQGPSRWKPWQKIAAGGALVAVVGIGGVAAVTAANASSSDSSTTQVSFGGGMPGSGGSEGTGRSGTERGGMAGVAALLNALHGDFVVSSGDGTQTMRLQSGEITELSGTSMTVKSTDGYTSTYAIGSGVDVSGLATGTTVRVTGTVNGDTVTATSVLSGTSATGGFGQSGQSGQSGLGGMPAPDGIQPPDGMSPPNGSGQAPQTS
jgi:hypothetical protein